MQLTLHFMLFASSLKSDITTPTVSRSTDIISTKVDGRSAAAADTLYPAGAWPREAAETWGNVVQESGDTGSDSAVVVDILGGGGTLAAHTA